MDYDQTSQLIKGTIPISGVATQQLFLSNPPEFFISSNKDSINLPKGTPVAVDASGTGFVRAYANTNFLAYGILAQDAAIGFEVAILLRGAITLSDWTLFTGTSLLAPQGVYYLSATPADGACPTIATDVFIAAAKTSVVAIDIANPTGGAQNVTVKVNGATLFAIALPATGGVSWHGPQVLEIGQALNLICGSALCFYNITGVVIT